MISKTNKLNSELGLVQGFGSRFFDSPKVHRLKTQVFPSWGENLPLGLSLGDIRKGKPSSTSRLSASGGEPGPSHLLVFRTASGAWASIWVWVKMKPPGIGPQVLVNVSICQRKPFWGYHIFEPFVLPNGDLFQRLIDLLEFKMTLTPLVVLHFAAPGFS